MGGIRTAMIERNTTIPANKVETFSTAVDNQPSVEINVLQGEREMAADNKSLGRFILDGITPAARGIPQIEVSFDIDANGILNVKAKDKSTGKEQHITIQGSTGMDEAEVDALVKEAEEKREEDKAKKESIDARNMADSAVHQAEKMIADNADKIEDADKESIEEKVADLKKALENADATKEELDEAAKPLTETMMTVGQKLYAAAETPEDGAESTESGDDEVVDAEVEDDDKDDGKKKKTRV